MFDRGSRQTITESVAESADSVEESADFTARNSESACVYGPLDCIRSII